MSTLSYLLTTLALAAVSTALAKADTPDASQIGITAVDYRGSGCPDGSIATNLAADAQAITLIFSSFSVDTSTRGGRPMRKVCAINITLGTAPGWQFTLFGVDLRGYASLQAGSVGVQRIVHSFGRGTDKAIGRQRLVGPFDNNFMNHSDLPLADLEWSPCDHARSHKFKLQAAIVVRPKLGFQDSDGELDPQKIAGPQFPFGYMTLDSLDGGLVHTYQVAWRRCNP